MATKRIPLKRTVKHRLTPAAIEAWQRGDAGVLHAELRLSPGLAGECSPLPAIFPFGVSEADEPTDGFSPSRWSDAVEIQRELVAAAGWPDCRDVIGRRLEYERDVLQRQQDRRADVEEHFRTGKHIVPLTYTNERELTDIDESMAVRRERIAWLEAALAAEEAAPGQGRWREAQR